MRSDRTAARHKASLLVECTKSTRPLAGLGGGVRHLSRNPRTLPSAFDANASETQAVTLFDRRIHYDLPSWRSAVDGSNMFDASYTACLSGPIGCFLGQYAQVLGTVTKQL